MNVTILYFARLKAEAHVDRETVETDAVTVEELYQNRQQAHGLDLPFSQLRAAVNESFCEGGTELRDGDVVAFMPPMSGG